MFDHNDPLAAAFGRLEESVMPYATLAGIDAAQATVKRRRTVRVTLAAAAGVVLIGGAALAVALTKGGPEQGVVATDPPVTTQPMVLLRDDDSPTPLDDARLELPDFHHGYCPTGQTQFQDGGWTGPGVPEFFEAAATIVAVVEGDVSGDGEADRVALIVCSAGTDPGAYAAQVVAFTKQNELLGQVAWASGGLMLLGSPEISDGKVRILHQSRPDGGPVAALEWRSYGWNGTAFQAAGQSSVPIDPRPTRLTVTLQPVRWTGDGRGVLTVSVTNNGGPTMDAVSVAMSATLPLTLTLSGTELTRSEIDDTDPYQWRFTIAAVPAGSTVTGTFEVSVASKALYGPGHLTVGAAGIGAGGRPLDNADNASWAELTVTR